MNEPSKYTYYIPDNIDFGGIAAFGTIGTDATCMSGELILDGEPPHSKLATSRYTYELKIIHQPDCGAAELCRSCARVSASAKRAEYFRFMSSSTGVISAILDFAIIAAMTSSASATVFP